MKFLKLRVIGLLFLTVCVAQATYQVEITFKNGAKRAVSELVIQSGSVVIATENLTVPFSQIKSAMFTFDDLSIATCDLLWKQGKYKELLGRLDTVLAPIVQAQALPGNIDAYLYYKMRALFWTGKAVDAQALSQILQAKKSAYATKANLYNILTLIEKKKLDQAADKWAAIQKIESRSSAMNEFVSGRLAMASREYEPALKHFSNVIIYYSRDPEWLPAATFYEGLIYKKTGYVDAAENIAEELKTVYPDAYWGERAKDIK